MRSKQIAKVTILCVLLALLVVFTGGQKPARAGAARRTIVIGMVAKSETNDVFQAPKTGAFDAAKDPSPKYNADITIEWRTPPGEDAQKQVDAINALVNKQADATPASCTNAAILTPAIN